MSDDWTHIWLEHKDAELTPEGRSWCDHDAWGDGAVEYIRADIAAARIAELETENARLQEGIAQLGRMWEANQDLLAESKEIDFLFEHTARIKELEAEIVDQKRMRQEEKDKILRQRAEIVSLLKENRRHLSMARGLQKRVAALETAEADNARLREFVQSEPKRAKDAAYRIILEAVASEEGCDLSPCFILPGQSCLCRDRAAEYAARMMNPLDPEAST